ncbi:MAG: TolC family protein [Fimbriimonadaceae bacterium]|nr:TolC family protein [Fimbriimonadaceae bacterium]
MEGIGLNFLRTGIGWAVLTASVTSMAQNPLTLDEALKMARERNGTIKVSYLSYLAAKSAVRTAEGAFLPTLTPDFSYHVRRSNFQTGGPPSRVDSTQADFSVGFSWTLLDSGERGWTLFANKRDAEAAQSSALNTLRNTLFLVHQQFYDALRSQELSRVQEFQLKRTETILDQTKTRVQLGDAPQKDILQANADFLNAKATSLQSRNRVITSHADLKATIGWDEAPASYELAAVSEPEFGALDYSREQAIRDGLANRPDLISQRKRVESARADLRLAKIAAGVTWSLDATAGKAFAPDVSDTVGLTLKATIPLFDGFRSREAVRTRQYSLDSALATLTQDERDARSEIEAAYAEFELNREILGASNAAREAARENFRAAEESQRLGAGDLIEVLTAQVSLATAESNYVQAVYDLLISDIQLRLVTGRPLPGETP